MILKIVLLCLICMMFGMFDMLYCIRMNFPKLSSWRLIATEWVTEWLTWWILEMLTHLTNKLMHFLISDIFGSNFILKIKVNTQFFYKCSKRNIIKLKLSLHNQGWICKISIYYLYNHHYMHVLLKACKFLFRRRRRKKMKFQILLSFLHVPKDNTWFTI